MKCDELQYERLGDANKTYPASTLVIRKQFVDAAIAELKEAQRWRKVSEEIPEDGAEVLATDGEEIWLCHKDTICDGSPWFQPDGLPHIEGITHWMPLPSAPKEEK